MRPKRPPPEESMLASVLLEDLAERLFLLAGQQTVPPRIQAFSTALWHEFYRQGYRRADIVLLLAVLVQGLLAETKETGEMSKRRALDESFQPCPALIDRVARCIDESVFIDPWPVLAGIERGCWRQAARAVLHLLATKGSENAEEPGS